MKKVLVLIVSLVALFALLLVASLANPIIELEDSNLEEVVREKLDRPEGDIYQSDLNTISQLDASNAEVTSLKGLERFSKLSDLNLEANIIEDWSPLKELFLLNRLNLSSNEITDIGWIEDIDNLIYLNLDNNNIEDLSPLADKISLEELHLANNQITSLESLEALYSLEHLNLESNRVNDLSPLKDLSQLRVLTLRNNGITSLEGINFNEIVHLPLESLSLRHNVSDGLRISDLSLLEGMISLEELELRDNHIEDISPISSLVNLKVLDLRENRFTDLRALRYLTQLEELNIRENDIDSIESLTNLINLEYLNLHSNSEIQSLEPLRNLTNLKTLIIRSVSLGDEFDILNNFTNLQRLNAIDSDIDNIKAQEVFSHLRSIGGLQDEVRPITLIQTVKAPVFSHEGGFYEEVFDLEISSDIDNEVIYYTVDGSEPTEDSLIYNEPITIGYKKEDRALVVRAKIITEDNNISETITNTYFVNRGIEDRFKLPLISIATDEENLFDEDRGIYVGDNALQTGSDWERPIHIEFFEKDGKRGLQQNGGIRIHGGWTRRHEHKTFRIYADSEYDNEDIFKYEIFDQHPVNEFKRFLLRTSGDDWPYTMFRDAMMQELVEPLDTVDTQAYRPSIIFINGEYWGIRNIRERYDEYYLSNTYDLSEDELVILSGNGTVNVGDPNDNYHYREMIEYIEANSLVEKSHYDYIQRLMDVESFRDYFVIQTYFGNHDWPMNNIRYWRLKTEDYIEDAPLGHDGRWRWMIFDTDTGFGWASEVKDRQGNLRDYTHNSIEWVMSELDGRYARSIWPNFLIRSLMENEDFRISFLNRYADLLNSYFLPEYVLNHIDDMQSVIKPEMDKHIERFGAISSMEEWYENVDIMRDFGINRPQYIRQHLMDEFNIEDTIDISIASYSDEGFVTINSLNVTDEWKGTYFKGIPLTVSAQAHPGYEFSHWEGLDENFTNESMEILPLEDMQLKAIFSSK